MVASLWPVLLSVTWAATSALWKECSVTLRRCLRQSKDSQMEAENNKMTVVTHNYGHQYKVAFLRKCLNVCEMEDDDMHTHTHAYLLPSKMHHFTGLSHVGCLHLTHVRHISHIHVNIHLSEDGVLPYSFFHKKDVNPLILAIFQPPLSSSTHWPSLCRGNNPFSLNNTVTVWLFCLCVCMGEGAQGLSW